MKVGGLGNITHGAGKGNGGTECVDGVTRSSRCTTDLKSIRNRVQAWYTMLPRPLAEAKNTVEHNIAARERAHPVHMKITLFVYLP